MTERERLLTLLKGETPDRVPWYGDLAYFLPYAFEQKIVEEKYQGDGLYDLHKAWGVGFYLQGYEPFTCQFQKVDIKRTQVGNEITTVFESTLGKLQQVERVLPQSYTVAIVEHLIKDIEDLEIYTDMMEKASYFPNYEEAEKRKNLVSDQGAVLCYLPKSPYMDLVALKSGIENVVCMMMDEEERFKSCLDRLEVCADKGAELALYSPAEFLMIPENISSEVVGKTPYHTYMERYHKKWFQKIKEAGKTSFVHMDGTMKGLLHEVSFAGARVMEALTPAPTGDIEIEDIQSYVHEDTIIWGGIPGAYFTDNVTDEDFDTYVIRVLKTWKSAPRYVLGVADQVPPYGKVKRILRVRALVDAYGKYEK